MELILIAECGVSGKKLTVGIQANKAKHSSGRIVVYGNSVTGWTSELVSQLVGYLVTCLYIRTVILLK